MSLTGMRAVKAGLAAAALLFGSVAPALAQTGEYRQQLDNQLDALRSHAGQDGREVVSGPFFGALEEDAKENYTLSVRRGGSYMIIGVCDNDCSDLDIRVYNTAGDLIGEDKLEDDAPIVELVPTASGRVRVEVEMYKCSEEPCYFAVEVYGKD